MKINQKYSKFKIDWEKKFNQKLKYHFDWDSLKTQFNPVPTDLKV